MSRWLLPMLVALSIVSTQGSACSPPYKDPNGFVDHPHLPANAKGVLFLLELPLRETRIGSISLLTEVPPALEVKDFSALETDTGRELPLRLEPLVGFSLPGRRYFQPTGERIGRCLRGFEHDECMALGTLKDSEQIDRWLEAQLTDASLVEVTSEMRKSTGMFRVEPRAGFTPGQQVRFHYSGGWLVGHPDTYVLVGTTDIDVGTAGFELKTAGEPQMRSVFDCGEASPSLIYPLRLAVSEVATPFVGAFSTLLQTSRDGAAFINSGTSHPVYQTMCGSLAKAVMLKVHYAVFEVADRTYETAPLDLDVSSMTKRRCQKMLRQWRRSGR